MFYFYKKIKNYFTYYSNNSNIIGRKWLLVVESGDFMLMGEFHHNIDDKLRIIIPSKLREELGEEVVITRGLENCLFIYSKNEWTGVVSKLKSLPFTKKDARNFNRMFLSGAIFSSFDKQGRIKLSIPLKKYASLEKECVVIGVNDRLELWSKDNWDNFMEVSKEEYSDLADNLFESNFND